MHAPPGGREFFLAILASLGFLTAPTGASLGFLVPGFSCDWGPAVLPTAARGIASLLLLHSPEHRSPGGSVGMPSLAEECPRTICFLVSSVVCLIWGSIWTHNHPMLTYDHEAAKTWIKAQCYVINRPKYHTKTVTTDSEGNRKEENYWEVNASSKFARTTASPPPFRLCGVSLSPRSRSMLT